MSDARKNIIQGMAQAAKQRRMDRMRKKYATGIPALDAVAESQDAAAEAATLPDVPTMPAKEPVLVEGMKEVNADASRWAAEDKAALDDEELQRYLAKR